MSAPQRLAAALVGGLALAGCSAESTSLDVAAGGFADGTYTGVSRPDDQGGYGEVSVTIAGNDVTATEFVLKEADGSVKGEDYGKTNGEIISQEVYAKAQAGIAAAPGYAAQFVETDDLSAVDVVTGASLSHVQFLEAVADALADARG